jgi:hypothetical protein
MYGYSQAGYEELGKVSLSAIHPDLTHRSSQQLGPGNLQGMQIPYRQREPLAAQREFSATKLLRGWLKYSFFACIICCVSTTIRLLILLILEGIILEASEY